MYAVHQLPTVALMALGLLVPQVGQPAGLQTLEQGTFELGRGMVGLSTAADSAATAYYNPAGMMLLDKPEMTVGLMGVFGDFEFDPDMNNTASGGDGGNQMGSSVVPVGPFVVYPINESWAAGFSFTAPFVGELQASDGWKGRYLLQKLDLATFRATPVVAYRVNEWLSIGGGPGINYTKLKIRAAIPTPGPGDGSLRISEADQWAFTFTAGIMLEPTEKTRIGVSYFSELDNDDLSGDIDIAGAMVGFSFSGDVALTLPQGIGIEVRHEVSDVLTLYGGYAWADFSEFETLEVTTSTGSGVTLKTSFHDAIAFGAGLDYDISDEWTVMAGVSYASSPVSKSDRNPALPFDRQIRYGTGIRYQWSEDLEVGLSYEYLDLGENKIRNSVPGPAVLSGKYDPAQVHFLALTFSKSF